MQLINIRSKSIITHKLHPKEQSEKKKKIVDQGYLQSYIPYRVSCPDQQGQTDPLITETADENESKMRPITTRA